MSGVRLRYAGVVNFLAAVVRLVISFGFVVVVTRRLSVEELGLWAIVLSLSNYLVMPMGFWGYWCSRFVARGVRHSLGTGLVMTLLYLPLSVLVYALAAYLIYVNIVRWGLQTMLTLGSLLITTNLLSGFLSGVSSTFAPEVLGYGAVTYDVLRLPLAYILVATLGLRLDGALLVMVISNAVAVAVMAYTLLRRGLRWDGVSFELVRGWFKGLSVPLVSIINGLLTSSDSLLLASISGSEVPVAYMSASYSLRNPVAYGQATASGLYAKILRGGSGSDVEEVCRLYFAITTYFLATITALSYPLMSLLNPTYRSAYWVALITSITTFIQGVTGILGSVVAGREEVDLRPEVSVKDFIKSKLFKWSALTSLSNATSLAVGTAILTALTPTNNAVLLASAYPLGWFVSSLTFLPLFYRMAKNSLTFRFPWRDVTPFLIAGSCSTLPYLMLGTYRIVVESFWRDVPPLLTHIIIAGVLYLTISYTLSPWLRNFLKAVRRFILVEVSRLER